ncbi:hypothetical protein ACFYYS_21090 [Streptomyces sp. NPDC002120]|uniref:hypothetical protein n=2 Tax=Streptomyces TaxID=1883 RepID=UPI0036967FDA
MTYGGHEGPSSWEMEKAYRRAQGEFIPEADRFPCINTACCCLVPAIAFAFFVLMSVVAAVFGR